MKTTITRAITIKSLWCWAVSVGVKTIENRQRSFPYRGRVALHMSQDVRDIAEGTEDFWEEHLYSAHPYIFDCVNDSRIGNDNRAALHPGCIVGSVEILDCVPFDPARDDPDQVFSTNKYRPALPSAPVSHPFAAIPRGMFATGPFCLVLAEPRRYATPIPTRGQLGLWGLSEELQGLVAKAEGKLLSDPAEPARVDRYLLTEAARKELAGV